MLLVSQPMRNRRPKGWKPRGPTIRRNACYIYFIEADVAGESFIKIGFTLGDVNKRCKALQLGSPVELRIAAYFSGTEQDESNLHNRFSALRIHREWFKCDASLRDLINEIGIPGEGAQ